MHEGGQRQLSLTDQGAHVLARRGPKPDSQLDAAAAARIQHGKRQRFVSGKERDRLANPALMHHRPAVKAARSAETQRQRGRHRRDPC